MAAGNFTISDASMLNMLNGATALLNAAGTYKLGLVTNSWTPSTTTTELWGDAGLSSNQIAGGTGYTTDGVTLDSFSIALDSGSVKVTCAAEVLTASGGGIDAWRYGVVYYSGTLNSKVNPVVGWFLGDSTPADVPATTAPNTLTITPNASGLFTANQA